MCGEVASPSVVELCDLSFTLSSRVRPEQGERGRIAPLGSQEFTEELWLGPTLEQTETDGKHVSEERVGSAGLTEKDSCPRLC